MSFNERIWYRDCCKEIWRGNCKSQTYHPPLSTSTHTPHLQYILHMTCQYMYNIYESVMLWHDIDLSMTEAEINLLHLILMMHLCHSCNTNRFSRYYDIIRVHVCTLYRAHFLFNLVPNPRGGESNVIIFSTL